MVAFEVDVKLRSVIMDSYDSTVPNTSSNNTIESSSVIHLRLVMISGSPEIPICFHMHLGAIHHVLPSP